jgi:hypothetical protein
VSPEEYTFLSYEQGADARDIKTGLKAANNRIRHYEIPEIREAEALLLTKMTYSAFNLLNKKDKLKYAVLALKRYRACQSRIRSIGSYVPPSDDVSDRVGMPSDEDMERYGFREEDAGGVEDVRQFVEENRQYLAEVDETGMFGAYVTTLQAHIRGFKSRRNRKVSWEKFLESGELPQRIKEEGRDARLIFIRSGQIAKPKIVDWIDEKKK